MKAVPDAQKLWQDYSACTEMVEMWKTSEEKIRHEQLIGEWAGNCGKLADVGCGAGRFARVMNFKTYIGFDGSAIMLNQAQMQDYEKMDVDFALVDIFNFQPDWEFDTLIMIDVAQHQQDPIESIRRVMQLWKAKRYYFSLLVGSYRQELSFSTIANLEELLNFMTLENFSLTITKTLLEPMSIENFGWFLMEIIDDQS